MTKKNQKKYNGLNCEFVYLNELLESYSFQDWDRETEETHKIVTKENLTDIIEACQDCLKIIEECEEE